MRFTIIDLLILVALVFAVSSGYRRGFWLSLAQYAGLVLGVIIGATLAPVLMDALKLSDGTLRSLMADLGLAGPGGAGRSGGLWGGEAIRPPPRARPPSGPIASITGAGFSPLPLLPGS